MRGQQAPSRGGQPRGTFLSRDGAAGSDGDALRVVRATRDQLGVEWSAEADPLSWRVVCWDSCDAAVARLKLTGTHRRATFAGLARLQHPFTIAVSGLGADGSVLWQAGLADLYLRPGRPAGRAGVSEAVKKGRGVRQDGDNEVAEAEEEDRAREVAAAGSTRAPRARRVHALGRADRVGRFAGASRIRRRSNAAGEQTFRD